MCCVLVGFVFFFRIVPWASSPVHSGFGIALLQPVFLSLRVRDCTASGCLSCSGSGFGILRTKACLGLHSFGLEDLEDEGLWGCLGLHCFGFGIVRTKGFFGVLVRLVVITPPPPHPTPPK